MITRRRFIAISATLAAAPLAGLPGAAAAGMPDAIWTGTALGARASIRIDHPEAEAIAARVRTEIERLDAIFSLYRTDSAIAALNRTGALAAPPFELLDCLATAGAVHRASGGAFDPTVQPLWALWAEAVSAGREPSAQEIAAVARGWQGVDIAPAGITLAQGMALTLNGIGQGYVADRIASLLAEAGLGAILIDTGEIRALGAQPDGADWPVTVQAGPRLMLADRALATSAPLGTTFDQAGRLGHILDPRTGTPVAPVWASVSVSAGSAALADALSTAACLMPDAARVEALVAAFPGARVESLIA
ncbi:MAG: FAD:protein FMN transferase [Rubellimicrobium sp.]|nr:FAD:protein FMN transferase [Rubellimicrobium sp.]